MAIRRRFTFDEQREHVIAYIRRPYGTKIAYLDEHGIGMNDFRKWRLVVLAGSPELGLIPRRGYLVGDEETTAMLRLNEQNEALRAQLAAQQAEHERAIAAKDADLATQRAAVQALGKAIELLHPDGASKSPNTSAGTDPAPT